MKKDQSQAQLEWLQKLSMVRIGFHSLLYFQRKETRVAQIHKTGLFMTHLKKHTKRLNVGARYLSLVKIKMQPLTLE